MYSFDFAGKGYTLTLGECLIVLTFALGFVFVVFYLIIELFQTIKRGKINRIWEEGYIPSNFDKNPEHVFELYIVAASVIIVRDPQRFGDKFGVVNRLLHSKFPNEYYHFVDSYNHSLRHVVKIDSLVDWCNKHFSRDEKIDLVNFMTEISVVDRVFTDEEHSYLLVFMQRIRIQFTDLEATFHRYFEPQQSNKVQEPSNHHLKSVYTVLGITETATQAEIKVAYRSLAKLTHPDRFMNQPASVREKMKVKFQEIQEAYETLMR